MSVSKASTHNRDNETNNNLKFHKSHGQNNADLSQSNTSEQEIVRNFGNFENSELDESKHIESNSTMLELSSNQTILLSMAHPVPESPNIHSYADIVKTSKTVPTTKESQDSQHVPSEPLIALKITKQLEDEFVGVERKRNKIKQFFLSGIAKNVKEQHILSFLAKQNIKPTMKVFRSRRKGTLSAKINLSSTVCSDVLKENVWPKHVVFKPWRSKMKDKLERPNSAQVTQLGKNSTLV